jgi:hypothetical protein
MTKTNQNIMKVELVSETDQAFKLYQLRFKTEKPKDAVISTGNKKISDIMGYLLEITIKHWISKSKNFNKNNIVKYNVKEKKRINTLFKEIDYVLQNGNTITIGEVKSTSSIDGNISQACKQLMNGKNLISGLYTKINTQFIWVDLYSRYNTEPLDSFYENFDEIKFRTIERNGIIHQFLHLNAEEVFKYGIKEKVIKSEELLFEVQEEMAAVYKIRCLKEEIKLNLNETQLNEKKEELKLAEYKLKLIQEGYIKIENESEKLITNLQADLNAIINITPKIIESNSTPTFKTFDGHFRYVCLNSEKPIKIHLLSSNAAYMRIPFELSRMADSIILKNSEKLDTNSLNSYPLINRNPYRHFFYSNELIKSEDENNEALKIFKKVISQSIGKELILSKGNLLIVDNHKMLHKLSSVLSNE